MNSVFSNNYPDCRRRSKTLQNQDHHQLTKLQLLLVCVDILQKYPSERNQSEKQYIHQLLHQQHSLKLVLSKNPEIAFELGDALGYEFFEADKDVFQQGDQGAKFYIILSGQVSIRIKIPDQNGDMILKEVAQMSNGNSFGELALLGLQTRSATVTTMVECHLATLDKIKYRKLIGEHCQQLIESKINFFSVYEFFRNWSTREVKSLCYELIEKQYNYNEVININNYMGFIKKGQIELRRSVERRSVQDHPLRNSKIQQETISIEILDEHKMIGELNFLDNKGNLTFTIDQKRQNLPNAGDINLRSYIANNRNSLYEAYCYSNNVKLYLLKITSIQERFYDQQTRQLFQSEIKKLLNSRLKTSFQLSQKFDRSFQTQMETLQISIQLGKVQRKSRTYTPNKVRCIRSYKTEEKDPNIMEFRDKIEPKLPLGILYKFQRLDDIESKSQYVEQISQHYTRIKTEEDEAKEEFQKMTQKMNFSYCRIKNFYEQKKLNKNKLFYQSFLQK